MSANNTTHILTVRDRREAKLNATPSLDAAYRFGTIEEAELLGQLLLERQIKGPGRWRKVLAGGTREVTIDPLLEDAA